MKSLKESFLRTLILSLLVAVLHVQGYAADAYTVNGITYTIEISPLRAVVRASESGNYQGSVSVPQIVKINQTTYNVGGIGEGAFAECTSLTSVTLPVGLTHIDRQAFAGCAKLTKVNIPSTCKTIGSNAFAGCQSLQSITLPKALIALGESIFDENIEYAGNVFVGCTSLTSINLESGNPYLSVKNGMLYDKDQTYLIASPGGKTSLTIAETTLKIGEEACSQCVKITSLSIPKSVQDIDRNAFWGCSKLATINFTMLDRDSFGSYVRMNILRGAFGNCPAIRSVYLRTTVPPSIKEDTFDSSVYSSATLYVPEGTKTGGYDSIDGWKLFKTIKELPGSGVDEFISDSNASASVEYFNLQGVRVTEPTKGIYIRRQGSKIEKVIVK